MSKTKNNETNEDGARKRSVESVVESETNSLNGNKFAILSKLNENNDDDAHAEGKIDDLNCKNDAVAKSKRVKM